MIARFLISSLFLLVLVPAVFAHQLLLTVTIKPEVIRIDLFYDDDTPASDAKVLVTGPNGFQQEGKTDEKGIWEFPKPGVGSYQVKASSAGHGAKVDFEIESTTSKDQSGIDDRTEDPTETPWQKIGMGLAVILGLALVIWFSKRKQALPEKPS